MSFDIPYTPRPARRFENAVWLVTAGILLLILIAAFAVWQNFIAPPTGFPVGQLISVRSGASVSSLASELKEKHVVRSAIAFKIAARLGDSSTITAGDYAFASPVSVMTIAHNFTHHIFGVSAVKVTFPEGSTTRDMAIALQHVPDFDAQAFFNSANTHEGYLFPDTYFVQPGSSPEALMAQMMQEFTTKTASLAPDLLTSKESVSDAVILASLLEREAKTSKDRRIIAGILENRITRGMPLQVDAVFGYIHSEDAYTPTAKDLSIDSPYNTYIHKGLPPGPIANPGLDALTDAVTPISTNYLYYITGTDGKMYYASTLAQHQKNISAHLRK